MDRLLQDLRYAFRGLNRSKGFTAVAIATLALGIGVNSSIFSLVNAVLLRPLPVEAPEELVNIYGRTATSSSHDSNSYPNYEDYREQTENLSGVMGYTNFFANLSVDGSSELVIGELVTEDYFGVLGVQPAAGRAFVPEEFEAPGTSPVAVLSHAFWQGRFGGEPDILGRTFRLNGLVYTVVGVAPQRFTGMFPAVAAQMWIPTSMVDEVDPFGNQRGGGTGADTRLVERGRHWLWLKGRMRPGVEVQQVRAELEGIASRLSSQYPETNELERVAVLASSDVAVNPDFDRTLAPAGMVLMGAVGLVLLVACANLANMMLARSSTRRKELAVRLALGANRGRLIRQMLTESFLLSLAGGAIAFLVAGWLSSIIAGLQPPLPIDLGLNISPDWRVLAFTLVAASVTGAVFGLVPALRASRPDLVPALKDGGDRDTGKGQRVGLRDLLVVVQVAVSLVLLVSGALLVRSLGEANRTDVGYDVDRVAYLGLAMEMNGYDGAASAVFYESGRLRLRELPQVEAVGLASRIPLSLNNNGFGVFIDGHQSSGSDEPYRVDGAQIDEGYFQALDLRLVSGRGVEPADREGGARVAVVTETMAQRYWPDREAVGQSFRTSWGGTPYQIIGVVEDYKVDTPGELPKPYIHIPLPRQSVFANFLVRTATPAPELVALLERELRTLDPELVFLETGSMRALADVRLFPIRAGAWLIGAFGALALVLAAVGLYGVIGYSVNRRVREIGIRKALGAETGKVLGLVMRQGMILVAIGGVVGAGLAALGARAISSVLYVGAFDPLSFAAAFGLLAGVAALANWVPAHRASRVDPMVVLRGD
ncbi:MAG: ABC transporter permease [Gemmatimonadetes bacterium]|nr:ABC transporter permease [Gemmatimonadota bacterium]